MECKHFRQKTQILPKVNIKLECLKYLALLKWWQYNLTLHSRWWQNTTEHRVFSENKIGRW